MTITTRKFTGSDADYKLHTTLWNKVWPEFRRSEKLQRHNDGMMPKDNYFVRLFLEEDGRVIGSAEYMDDWETAGEDDYFFMLSIDPDEDFARAADVVFEIMNADFARLGAKTAGAVLMEDRESGCEYFQQQDYTIGMREPRSELDVTEFDFDPYDGVPDKVAVNGIEIANLVELQTRFPDWQRRIYDLEWPIVKDVPSTVELKQEPFEDFQKNFQSPTFIPEAAFYALDGEEWVGVSTLKRVDDDNEQLAVGITGVLRSHRRKGIATALKLETIKFAQEYGAKIIKTTNEENNPMYDLNLSMGFKPKPALLIFEKKFEETPVKEVQHGS